MKLTIATACYNQLEDTKIFWGNLVANTANKQDVELLVINNNSTDGTIEFLDRFVFPHFPDHNRIDNPDNVGVLKSMQQIVDNAKGEVIAIVHNDLFILEPNWNNRVMIEFENDPKLGLAGFLGAKGVGATGGRMFTMSNMLEAEYHGDRITGVEDAVIFDGLALIGRKAMFDAVGGFDQGYTFHHFYDRDISMASFTEGWKNKVIGIYCHHKSGVTANRPDYQIWIDKKMGTANFTGDKASYDKSEQHFIEKWRGFLPNRV